MEVTDIAKDKIKSHLANRGKGIGIRIGIETTGCSGYAYKLEFADKINEEDIHNLTIKRMDLMKVLNSLIH
jgi:iron-sulfur cluster assembly protein